MKKRLLILAGVGAVTCAAVLLDPTCVLLGLLRNEGFYRGRPTTYWGRALRDEDPTVQVETRKVLKEGVPPVAPKLTHYQSRSAAGPWTPEAALYAVLGYLRKSRFPRR
ncbi:MAG TPA: hypothetical protein VKI65_19600, partial [Gemmataceae bacterium]|nr:hypothetical protein [Gemmataceae bacterium]